MECNEQSSVGVEDCTLITKSPLNPIYIRLKQIASCTADALGALISHVTPPTNQLCGRRPRQTNSSCHQRPVFLTNKYFFLFRRPPGERIVALVTLHATLLMHRTVDSDSHPADGLIKYPALEATLWPISHRSAFSLPPEWTFRIGQLTYANEAQ